MISTFNWIYNCIKPFKWTYLITILFVVVETGANTGLIAIQKWIIDEVAVNGRYSLLLPILLCYGAIILLFAAMFTLTPFQMKKNEGKLTKQLSCNILRQLYRTPIRKLNEARTGHYFQVINNEIPQLSRQIANDLPRGIQHLSTIIFIGTILVLMSVNYMLFVLSIGVVYSLIGKYFIPKIKRSTKEVIKRRSDFIVTIEESVSSTREIIAYNREKWEQERNSNTFKRYFVEVMKELRWSNAYQISGEILKWTCNVSLLAIGGYLIMKDSLSIGLLVISYQLVSQLVTSLHELFQFMASLTQITTLKERYDHLTELPEVREGKLSLTSITSLNFDNVNYNYQAEKSVIKGVSLDLPIGKKVAFVGTSGSGKSTMGHLLMNFFDPQQGGILINGRNMKEYNREDLSSKIGIVFQDPYIFGGTMISNITLRDHSDDVKEEVMRIAELTGLTELINKLALGLDTSIGERGMSLSGGERQRLAVARALWMNREILILDEATSALDFTTEKRLMECLKSYREGMTTIIVAHRLSTVKDADLIVVVDNGIVIEKGNHNELLMNNSTYSKLIASVD
ncbi:ABC transporter ATP-binding protein [Paenibacillus glacialis]|uniref:ABC transporter ATP-binding protein n=1 Tax=Paenibacillus glacialis TaxID=494026 RepID=A0A168D0G5_9BACL|nr:ABC transporter ATP-binding protein [Paenibacillus glacialis]OAB33770.1 hypothetical protein PGLA_22815 [Paenibacillus glacialis]